MILSPFFYSFGFTATLVFPLTIGVGVVCHPNPLDARVIGALIRKYAVTFLMATPTFLQAYIRRSDTEDFGSLEFVLAGAEKLSERGIDAGSSRHRLNECEYLSAPRIASNSARAVVQLHHLLAVIALGHVGVVDVAHETDIGRDVLPEN